MSYEFAPKVKEGLDYIYYNMRTGDFDGEQGILLLKEATDEGDRDAPYFLARCYGGTGYVWNGLGISENDKLFDQYLNLSIQRKSPIGILGGMRSNHLKNSGITGEELYHAFEEVKDAAEYGEAFCQYVYGNTYFWGDYYYIPEIYNDLIDRDDEDVESRLRKGLIVGEKYLKKSFQNGLYLAGDNLFDLYRNGKGNLFSKLGDAAAFEIFEKGAKLGYPNLQSRHGERLLDLKRHEEAYSWIKKAMANNESMAYFQMARYYECIRDYGKAVEYYDKAAQITGSKAAYGNVGILIHQEMPGVELDFFKAEKYFEIAYRKGNTWVNARYADMLIFGKGTKVDYKRAKWLLDECTKNGATPLSNYLYGVLYGRGLGVEVDIPKAIGYLEQSDDKRVVEEKSRYKKTLFGKWVQKKK